MGARRRLLFLALLASGVGGWLLYVQLRSGSARWLLVSATIRARFPQVRQLPSESLALWLDGAESAPLLLDVRAREEFEVSHLPGARWVPSESLFVRPPEDSARTIVVYCSVGVRSSAYAQRLLEAGVPNVYNLEGSIFAWANEGRPVYRRERRVERVHPYDDDWGNLLDARYREP